MEYNKYEEILIKRGYVVSEEGQAYNKKGKKVGYIGSVGRAVIRLRHGGIINNCPVHRLQAYQKYGDAIYQEGVLVRHLDGDCSNNSWDNIAIGTHSDNMMDIPKQIRVKKAVHAASFRKRYDNDEVKDFHVIDRSYKKTMEKFGITSKGTLNYILKH